jgi:monoamine oxidase
LAERIAAEIGDHIRLGEPVAAVTESADRVDVVTAAGRRFSARRVVLAAPLNTLGDIRLRPSLPTALARLVEQGHTGHCVKV